MFRKRILRWLLEHSMADRTADLEIKHKDGSVYLNRWYIIPRNKIFNIYFHLFTGSDHDRAIHDHPWFSISWILSGSYLEESSEKPHLWPLVKHQETFTEGDIVFRSPWTAHRIILFDGFGGKPEAVMTLFITGPVMRKWGFWKEGKWIPYDEYLETTEHVDEVNT